MQLRRNEVLKGHMPEKRMININKMGQSVSESYTPKFAWSRQVDNIILNIQLKVDKSI